MCVCEFMPAKDCHLNQWMKSKACAQDFAVSRDLEKALLIAQGVIMYLMEANLSLPCTQVKCFDFAKWVGEHPFPSATLMAIKPCEVLPDVAEVEPCPCSS